MATANGAGAPFGSILANTMALAHYEGGAWSSASLVPTRPIEISPAAHSLHYGSSCFEGFKAYRHADGEVYVFRLDRHVLRLSNSAAILGLPVPDGESLSRMVLSLIDRVRGSVPEPPGALYLRPILMGTTANIGAASMPPDSVSLIVLASPVWDYFIGGMKPLRIVVDTVHSRTAPHLGVVKTGGNYAAAMKATLAARSQYAADQVLFCPGGEVQETGASNFLLLRSGRVLTRCLDSTFLHGVTRASLLTLASEMGYSVEERVFTVAEMLDWVCDGEAALSGTAAVLTGVGTLIHDGREHAVGRAAAGAAAAHTRALREALVAIQQGKALDRHKWLTRVPRS